MKNILLLFFVALSAVSFAQQKKHSVSGKLKDAATGEDLIGGLVYIEELKTGTQTNSYGFYSISIPDGKYTFIYSYIGYDKIKKVVDFSSNQTFNIELEESKKELNEVLVTADKPDAKNVQQNKMSVIKIDMKDIKNVPLLLGELDIIKVLQLLPGIQQAGDGSTLFTVRGGNVDQNLILLDEAVVYNPSHVAGFFSVFNGDAIKDFEIYKGGIPSNYGGRLSSVLDVRMKDGNSKEFGASGGIGILSSRLTFEGPIQKGKSSFMISGRRSYFDLFFPFTAQLPSGASAYFYDLNVKLNYEFSAKDRLYLSGYFGRDLLSFGSSSALTFGTSWGNTSGTIRWNHVFSNKLFMNASLLYSNYDYNYQIDQSTTNNYSRVNYITDFGGKVDFSYYISPKSSLKFGFTETNHTYEPGKRVPVTSTSNVIEVDLPLKNAIEQGYYVSHKIDVSHKLNVEYGLRTSIFSNYGGRSFGYQTGAPTYIFNGRVNSSSIIDTLNYKTYEVSHTSYGFEPRLNIVYQLDSRSSIKASYNRMYQYMSLIQNITASVGQEFWTPSDNYIKPQYADQVAFGYFRNFKENTIEASAEVYYKRLQNTVELKDNAVIDFNEAIESQVVAGQGRAYGIELFVRKQRGKTTGWVGYTLSKSERQADGVNNGNWYPFRYDRTNYLTVVLSQVLSKRVTISGNFIYGTGEAFTTVIGRYQLFDPSQPQTNLYGARNSLRYPAYNRMDISLTLGRKEIPGRVYKNKSEWIFAIYNVYGYKNAYTIDYEMTNGVPTAYKYYLFTYVPSITYNFKF
jgi:CarboxypepD_reg-like domain/TonB-dependent Receptor Plug Domain